MSSSSEKNSRIAKNTLVLYLRSVIVLLVTLYTTRVVLATLGVEDYGIYHVIVGLVAVFSSISGALSASVSRFLAFELGRGDDDRLKAVFSTSLQLQAVLAFIIIFLILSVGTWFLETELNIPPDRMESAQWVLIISALSFGLTLVGSAYNALIIAHECMGAFACIEIVNVLLKLSAVMLLTVTAYDNLKSYAAFILGVTLLTQACYWLYCRSRFKESRFQFVLDKDLLRHMFGFSGWASASHAVGMLNTQGVNILTNVYFGVALNAARSIASQVEAALNQFISNLTVSVNPQIIKSYATDDKAYMFGLICSGSKFAYFSALVFIIPLFIEAETVLELWLGTVPDYATLFVRLVLLTMLPQVLGGILYTAAMATGYIRNYSILVNGVSLLNVAFVWSLFRRGFPAEVAYVVHLFIRFVLVALRVFLLKKMMCFSPLLYFRSVVLRILPVSLLATVAPLLVIWSPIPESFLRVLSVTVVSVPVTLVLVYFMGLTDDERRFLADKLTNFKGNFHKG